MIALVRGDVATRGADQVVVECTGVGYRLAVSAQTMSHVPAAGRPVMLHTHLIAREDGLHLYGFHSERERELFLMLLAVPSVGPKVALAVLSGGPVEDLLTALAAGDATRFQAVPGIGKRTAERIIVELREKAGIAEASGPAISVTRRDDPRRLARDGLLELGYDPAEAQSLLAHAEGASPEELIAAALREAHTHRSGPEEGVRA